MGTSRRWASCASALFNKRRNDLITLNEMGLLIQLLEAKSVEERIQKLGLNHDRADVLLPAVMAMEMIVRAAGVKEVLIPGVGLKDGVLLEMAPQAAGPRLPRTSTGDGVG